MKRLTSLTACSAILSLAVLTCSARDGALPGQVDFGKFSPPSGGGDYVEVNLPGSLISMAARLIEKQEPDAAKILAGLQLVHVNVIGMDDQNRDELQKRIQKVRKDLEGKGWEKIVVAQKDGKDVNVFLKTNGKEAVQGLALVVIDGDRHAVFVNVVGDIRPEQLAMLGDKLHIDPLKNLGNSGPKEKEKSE
jgi:hypothetical protein